MQKRRSTTTDAVSKRKKYAKEVIIPRTISGITEVCGGDVVVRSCLNRVFFLIPAASEIVLNEANITGDTDLMKIRACVGMAVDMSRENVAKNIREGKQFVAFLLEPVSVSF